MNLDEALPQLLTTYRQGLLVPFIGSGMSMPACAGWVPFVKGLAHEAQHEISAELLDALTNGRPASTELYRLADICVRRLKARGRQRFAEACRSALHLRNDQAVPPQTKALAQIYWPLVMSTNYDDVLLQAVKERQRDAKRTGVRTSALPALFEVAGQSVQDCHVVLRSLDVVTPPVLWVLQGYLGRLDLTQTDISPDRAARLEHEVVIGHQQYQTVINAHPHLRRAVAEVFRRRSLLFLGSGVQEDYLVNLFGEIIHHHGVSAHRHYALFQDSQRGSIDLDFFRLRLGIEPLFVQNHAEVPSFLDRFKDNIPTARDRESPQRVFGCATYEVAYQFSRPTDNSTHGLVLRLRHETLRQVQSAGECVGVSVGRGPNGPILGNMARALLRLANVPEARNRAWNRVGDSNYVFRHQDEQRIFAVAARHEIDTQPESDQRPHDRRHLLVIPNALGEFLDQVDTEFQTATMGLLASGDHRPWPALFPFVMMLRGVRAFAARGPRHLRELTIAVVDPAVWLPLRAGKLPVEMLLSSDTATAWVHVVGETGGDPESYSLALTENASVAAVAQLVGLPPGRWQVQVYPIPSGDPQQVENCGELAVVPGATVTFMPTSGRQDDTLVFETV